MNTTDVGMKEEFDPLMITATDRLDRNVDMSLQEEGRRESRRMGYQRSETDAGPCEVS